LGNGEEKSRLVLLQIFWILDIFWIFDFGLRKRMRHKKTTTGDACAIGEDMMDFLSFCSVIWRP